MVIGGGKNFKKERSDTVSYMSDVIQSSDTDKMGLNVLHKGSGVAVRNAKWYIAECKPTRELSIRACLQKAGYEVYVASRKETHIYKSRNRREVERVLLSGRIFVRTEERKLMDILLAYSSVWRFQKNRAAKPNANGILPYAFVPEDQMQQLQFVLKESTTPVIFSVEDFHPNQEVQIIRGPMAGFRGWFTKKGHTAYIVIRVEMGQTNYVFSEILAEDVQPV